jgi:hypothetical protein
MTKKQSKTSKSTKSALKKPSKHLKTHIDSKNTTSTTVPKAKRDGKSLAKPKSKDSSLSSTWTLPKTKLGSLAQDALASVKKRSTKDLQAGGDGWVKATSAETEGMTQLTNELRKAKGRPRRNSEEISQVAGLRLTPKELHLIEKRAHLAGFASWRDWARKILLGEIEIAS